MKTIKFIEPIVIPTKIFEGTGAIPDEEMRTWDVIKLVEEAFDQDTESLKSFKTQRSRLDIMQLLEEAKVSGMDAMIFEDSQHEMIYAAVENMKWNPKAWKYIAPLIMLIHESKDTTG